MIFNGLCGLFVGFALLCPLGAEEEKAAVKESLDEAEVVEVEELEEVTEAPKEKKAEEGEKKEAAKVDAPRIYGWREWVWVVKPDFILRAKLDTGARTCSIHATNVEVFESDGKKWVQFTISDPADEKSPRLRHKAPVVRIAKIKNDRGGLDERYVVPMTFQVGDRKIEAEFNLNDREEMVCAVLVGRNALENLGVVDSSRTDVVGKPRVKNLPPRRRKKRPTRPWKR
ncbi:MAG: ATP-dependent zinc protease [Verrucomicrobiales bacterium]